MATQKQGDRKEGDDLTIYAPRANVQTPNFFSLSPSSGGFSHHLTVAHAVEQAKWESQGQDPNYSRSYSTSEMNR